MAYDDKTYRGNDTAKGLRHAGVKPGDGFSAGGNSPGIKNKPSKDGMRRMGNPPKEGVDGDGFA